MKKYKKKPKKLFQVRLSEKEYKQLNETINRFGVTRRAWIVAVTNELREKNVIREDQFFINNQEFAYFNNEKWDKQLTDDSICELCGAVNGHDDNGHYILQRHHYLGYEGENAFKVIILCKPCHYKEEKIIRLKKKKPLESDKSFKSSTSQSTPKSTSETRPPGKPHSG